MSDAVSDVLMNRVKEEGVGVTKLLEDDNIDPIKAVELGHGLLAMTIQIEHYRQLTRIADSLEKAPCQDCCNTAGENIIKETKDENNN